MNGFFSADWETASSDTERGNEGGRKEEIYAAAAETPTNQRKEERKTDGGRGATRTDKRGLNSVAARFMFRERGGRPRTDAAEEFTDAAFPAE